VNESTYRISEEQSELDGDLIFQWLSYESYWAKGRDRDVIDRFLRRLLPGRDLRRDAPGCGGPASSRMARPSPGFCDVFVDEGHRGHGLGHRLAQWAVEWIEQRDIPRAVLATADAHGVYAALGFQPVQNPQRWMEIDRRPQQHSVTERENARRAGGPTSRASRMWPIAMARRHHLMWTLANPAKESDAGRVCQWNQSVAMGWPVPA